MLLICEEKMISDSNGHEKVSTKNVTTPVLCAFCQWLEDLFTLANWANAM